jgi:hypothetical protein
MNKKSIISLMLCGLLMVPIQIEAKGSHHSSHSSHSSSSFNSSKSKPATLKSGKSILKTKVTQKSISTKNENPTVSKVNLTKTPIVTKPQPAVKSTSTKTNPVKISNLKVDSGSFTTKSKTQSVAKHKITYTVKPKPQTKKSYVPKYYKSYSARTVYHHTNNDFLTYYALSNLFDDDDDVTERDIVRELESRGYSHSEIDDILYQGRTEQQKVNKNFKYEEEKKFNWTISIIAIGGIIYIITKIRK